MATIRSENPWAVALGLVLAVLMAAATAVGTFLLLRSVAPPDAWPGAPADQRPTRILPAVTGPAGVGGYRFTHVHADGTPVAYDPCRPIHWVLNDAQAPAGTRRLVTAAVRETSRATGLRFVFDGPSTEPVPADRSSIQPARYGTGWAPVLITWTNPAEFPPLAGDIAGVGGSAAAGHAESSLHYVTGRVALDAPQVADLLAHTHDTDLVRALITHELGHLAGLDHVDDQTQLMYPSTPLVRHFADGDRRGLAQLGAGRCHPEG